MNVKISGVTVNCISYANLISFLRNGVFLFATDFTAHRFSGSKSYKDSPTPIPSPFDYLLNNKNSIVQSGRKTAFCPRFSGGGNANRLSFVSAARAFGWLPLFWMAGFRNPKKGKLYRSCFPTSFVGNSQKEMAQRSADLCMNLLHPS